MKSTGFFFEAQHRSRHQDEGTVDHCTIAGQQCEGTRPCRLQNVPSLADLGTYLFRQISWSSWPDTHVVLSFIFQQESTPDGILIERFQGLEVWKREAEKASTHRLPRCSYHYEYRILIHHLLFYRANPRDQKSA